MQDYGEIIASIVAGTGISSVLVRALITKSLQDISIIVNKIAEIRTELAAIAVRLENLDRTHDLLHTIDRKVIALETRIYGKHTRPNGLHSEAGM